MKNLYTVLRVFFGLVLVVFGLNGFLQFMGGEPNFNEQAMAFMAGLMSGGFLMPVMSLIFLLAGIAFIFNLYAPLFAVLLAPITFNILLFHVFLDMTGMGFAAVFILLNLYMLWANLDKYKPMLKAK